MNTYLSGSSLDYQIGISFYLGLSLKLRTSTKTKDMLTVNEIRKAQFLRI